MTADGATVLMLCVNLNKPPPENAPVPVFNVMMPVSSSPVTETDEPVPEAPCVTIVGAGLLLGPEFAISTPKKNRPKAVPIKET